MVSILYGVYFIWCLFYMVSILYGVYFIWWLFYMVSILYGGYFIWWLFHMVVILCSFSSSSSWFGFEEWKKTITFYIKRVDFIQIFKSLNIVKIIQIAFTFFKFIFSVVILLNPLSWYLALRASTSGFRARRKTYSFFYTQRLNYHPHTTNDTQIPKVCITAWTREYGYNRHTTEVDKRK